MHDLGSTTGILHLQRGWVVSSMLYLLQSEAGSLEHSCGDLINYSLTLMLGRTCATSRQRVKVYHMAWPHFRVLQQLAEDTSVQITGQV